jgi:hypothetical protein
MYDDSDSCSAHVITHDTLVVRELQCCFWTFGEIWPMRLQCGLMRKGFNFKSLFTIKFQWKQKFLCCVDTKWHNAH